MLTDLGGGDGASALVVQPDGKVVAAGGSTVNFALARYHSDGSLLVAAGASTENFALARYHPDGSLDSGFGNGGVVLTDFGAASFALVRYNPDGGLLERPAKTGSMADSAGTAATVARGATRSPGVNAVRGEAPNR